MRAQTALLFCVATCCDMAAQQAAPAQSTTTFQSSISGSATTVTPPKYYVGMVDLSKPASGPKEEKCGAARKSYQLKSDLNDIQDPYLLGEVPVLFHVTTTDGCPTNELVLTVTTGREAVKVTPDPSGSGYFMTFLKAGPATIHAEEVPVDTAARENPVCADWNVIVEENTSTCITGLLPQKPPKKAKADPSSVVQYLGNAYSFQVVGEKLLVYSSKRLEGSERKAVLSEVEQDVQGLLGIVQGANPAGSAASSPPSPSSSAASPTGSPASGTPAAKPAYSIEVSVPHASALGDLATRLSTVNYPDFTVQDVGSSKIRISSAAVPSCSDLTAFLRDLRDVAWKPVPDNPVAKLFFLNASDINGALSSGPSPPASSPSSAAPNNSQPGNSAASGESGPSGASGNSATGGGSSSTSKTTVSGTSATTAGGTGSSSAGVSSSGSGTGGTSGAPSSSTAGGNASGSGPGTSPAAPGPPTVSGVGTDTLLFQDAVPGDDAAVTERKRLVALLDLPRPQMIINVWSLQTSLTNEKAAAEATEKLHELAEVYNKRIQDAFGRGWQYLRDQISVPANYFDPLFYRYITGRYVQDPDQSPLPSGLAEDLIPQVNAERVLKRETGPSMPPELRRDRQICPPTEYCLGYTSIFQPLQPRLTDLLIATIAASDPPRVMNGAVSAMEEFPAPPEGNCVDRDREGAQNDHFYLECFREAANSQFSNAGSPSSLGLLRAALADFLFEYKLSQMYPHEFDDYYLSQSAQTLDARLAPLVDAFNRDLTTFQAFFSESVMNPKESGPDYQHVFGSERPKLVNNGMISVRTISGFESVVSTTSQNFLDATQMPTVSALAQSITGAAQGSSTSGGKGMTNVLQNISPIQAQVILGALSAYQSSKVQIGRSLSIDVTPRSLSGASSAEITVKINADEAASPTYFNSTGTGNSADVSRVANHDTSTRVRVDSIKLFDVSTFTAVLQKSRTRFPLLPPLVEIPYVGTLIGIPLPVAKEFHSSTAVLSTIIVPTAADIALGLTFTADQMVDSNGAGDCTWPEEAGYYPPPVGQISLVNGFAPVAMTPRAALVDANIHLQPCKLRKATFLSDLKSYAIGRYHLRIISCLANSGVTGAAAFDSSGLPAAVHPCSYPDYLSLTSAGSLE